VMAMVMVMVAVRARLRERQLDLDRSTLSFAQLAHQHTIHVANRTSITAASVPTTTWLSNRSVLHAKRGYLTKGE
jgi:hypothetical protein